MGNRSIDKVGGWVTWDVAYAPGALTAQAHHKGSSSVCAQTSVATTGDPVALRLSIKDGVGAAGVAADGADVALVMAEVVDAQGRVVPVASNVMAFSVDSPTRARIIGTGNGDPASHTPDKSLVREAFNGLALAIVQSVRAPTGAPSDGAIASAVTVSASSPGLRGASVTITLLPAADRPSL